MPTVKRFKEFLSSFISLVFSFIFMYEVINDFKSNV